MMVHIHYRLSDGAIIGHESGTIDPKPINSDHGVLYAQLDRMPDFINDKVDLNTLEIVKRNSIEKKTAAQPTRIEIVFAIFRALQASDGKMLPDRDDLTPQTVAAWKQYRKALRSLKDQSDVVAMINAWPIDPDGNDPIADLRNRL